MTNPETILEHIAQLSGVTVTEIIGRRRYRRLAEARLLACWALRQAGMGFQEIGDLLERHHSTIIDNRLAAIARAERDPRFAAKLRVLKAAIEPAADEPPDVAAPPAALARRRHAVALQWWVSTTGLLWAQPAAA